MNWKKNKLFYRYLISYVLIMLIPTIIFTAYINQALLSRLRSQYMEDTAQTLNQFRFSTDKNIAQLQMIRDHILSRTDIVTYKNLENISASRTIISELKKYSVSNPFISDLLFYLEGDSYIYTSGSTYPLDAFFSNNIYYQNWSPDDFLDMVSNTFSLSIRPEETISLNGLTMNVVTILYPVQVNNTKAVLLFLVDSSNLHTNDPASAYLIRDAGGNTIFSRFPDSFPASLGEIYENQSHYLICSQASEEIGWEYVKIVSIQDVYGDFYKIQRTFYYLFLLILAAGGIFIYFSMFLNYNPLHKLKEFTESILDGHNREQDEIQSITGALNQLIHENSELKDQTWNSERIHFLRQLLKGRISKSEQTQEQIEALSLSKLLNPYYFVIVLCIKAADRSQELPDPYFLENQMNRFMPGYILEHSEGGKYVFLGSLSSPDSLAYFHHILDIQDSLHKALHMDVALASSRIYSGMEQISKCYLEASLAVDYRFIKGPNCVIDSSQLALNEEIGAVYPQQLFEKLNYQIKSGDADSIQEILNEIIAYIKTSDLPLYYAKGLCYQLINNVSSIIEHINHDLTPRRNKLSYATVLADFDTAEELMDAVRNISLNICSYIRNEKQEGESRILTDIKSYIDQQALDCSFSVQNMAEHFQMSQPAISAFFKYHCGITIIEYVTNIRMQRATELLLEERLTINDIVTAVGYLNTSSFIRKFKSIYGLTPGQYVKNHKENSQL